MPRLPIRRLDLDPQRYRRAGSTKAPAAECGLDSAIARRYSARGRPDSLNVVVVLQAFCGHDVHNPLKAVTPHLARRGPSERRSASRPKIRRIRPAQERSWTAFGSETWIPVGEAGPAWVSSGAAPSGALATGRQTPGWLGLHSGAPALTLVTSIDGLLW
jgi:hypothetical protein